MSEPPSAPRRTPGVALEVPAALPVVRERAAVGTVVGLREREVEDVVRAYVLAFDREDVAALEQLLSSDARPLGRSGTRTTLLDGWKARLRGADRMREGAVQSVRFRDIEIYDEAMQDIAGGPARPEAMGPRDVFVRVPITKTRGAGGSLFGETLLLLLRREGGKLRIVGQSDEG